ncbi:putative non-specific serine/threonine protein kinase [Helianthus annuus]|uniref:Non-specific serine/threonine protein kinase n=1 Tax=Helianthus annuus TaxID=4232 RepID=A0A251SAV8_HELAN|nr:receptor-like serine/threonine-protein kinase SD1-8 [Helianthus annuus]KAF5765040.1 putative non-specific serine/threonine protein kinase [Helianthus annuus]KAJ0456242.1 putative non-specific serine/threonine protein kinase [Helianthus annuus]KAJ0473513.1 putative non-specific serine/threonine protein kinase [Helianthus annuus]KAJ0831758.1 putative non-specific serine/threonine protein kinase [Helianthus annuus]
MRKPHFHTTIFMFLLLFPVLSLATDTITPTTPITVNQTLVSNQQVFELGFFSLDNNNNNNNWYIGIWYKQIEPKTYVWVANRGNPVNSSSGKLTIGGNGNIILFNQPETAVWTSNDSNHSVRAVKRVAQLLDSGNFVLRPKGDERPESYIWESFKNLTDTLLPGMRLGWDRKTGVNRFLRSWKSGMDPGSSSYTFKMNVDGFPEIFLSAWVKPVFRSGPWNGRRFSGVPTSRGVRLMELWFVNNYVLRIEI